MNSFCIQDYLSEIDLKGYDSLHAFWRELDSKYPRAEVKLLEHAYARLEEGDEESFYHAIYQNYDTAFSFAGLRIPLYKSVSDWVVKSLDDYVPRTILDAGCGNGILTCYLARLYPEAKVLGVDINEFAVKHAQTLAEKLNLTNVQFQLGDTGKDEFRVDTKTGSFDLILSVASMGPQQEFDFSISADDSSLAAWFSEKGLKCASPQLENLGTQLSKNGWFLTFEKLNNAKSQLSWMGALKNASLFPDVEKSQWLSYECIEGDIVSLPAIVCCGVQSASDAYFVQDALSFLLQKSNPLSSLDLSFGQEALCDLLFNQLHPKIMRYGCRADFHDGSGSYFYEIWDAGPLRLSYEHTSRGYRNLRILPLYAASELVEAFGEWMVQTAKYADIVSLTEQTKIVLE